MLPQREKVRLGSDLERWVRTGARILPRWDGAVEWASIEALGGGGCRSTQRKRERSVMVKVPEVQSKDVDEGLKAIPLRHSVEEGEGRKGSINNEIPFDLH